LRPIRKAGGQANEKMSVVTAQTVQNHSTSRAPQLTHDTRGRKLLTYQWFPPVALRTSRGGKTRRPQCLQSRLARCTHKPCGNFFSPDLERFRSAI
jgi:hypothetical protein